MTAPPEIVELVERFQRSLDVYKRADYKETRVRVEFIDPFFEALGWDVRNVQGYAEPYKDVVHEDALKVGAATRAPDYGFRIGGTRKFFVEAKKPAVAVGKDVDPAYQLRRYAWNVKLPLGILTDFEEFAVYDCRQRPRPGDKAAVGRVMFLTYEQYPDRWDEIAAIFARDSVLRGSFDRYAQETAGKRGTSEVDAELLKEIEGWRVALAHNIALRNPTLSVHELNFAVQQTIDRIIFLRMAEDRGIEEYGRLLALTAGSHIYPRLVSDLYRQADEKYNAGLFDFQADTLTRSLVIDDRVLKPILAGLYYPDCPYEFSVLPTEVLGQVYEQFLGKVIRLTPGHRAVVEEKPEVKKAGGVYYTPSYIVNYIVHQTVGRLVEGKSPRELAGTRDRAPLRILDPACGSGSFLLGAYQYLLDWHLQRYLEERDTGAIRDTRSAPIYQSTDGSWRLTTAEKKRILLDHIYGVDIDRQAVEVTKLSLLLKVLEGETDETLGTQLRLWRERALPDLGNNVKCGNSLIGPDYFAGQLLPDEEAWRRVNPFDWASAFPQVFRPDRSQKTCQVSPGFDVIIGNPPYIRIQTMKEWAPSEVEFYKQRYTAASKGNYDIYVVFVERALQLLNERGRMGFILPHKFFQAQYGAPLRRLIAEGRHLAEIVHFGDQQVFAGATTYTCLLFLDKAGSDACRFVKVGGLGRWRQAQTSEVAEDFGSLEGRIPAESVTGSEWNFVVGRGAALFERLRAMPVKLGDVSSIFVGLQTSADTVFLFKDCQRSSATTITVISKELGQSVELESRLLQPVIRSGDIGRYWAQPTALVLFPYEKDNGRFRLIPDSKLKAEYPKTWAYLVANRKLLAEREHGKFRNTGWYQLYPKNLDTWEQPKIMLPYMITRLAAHYDDGGFYFVNVTTGGFGVTVDTKCGGPKYVTGLLNSRLLDWFMKRVSTTFHGGYLAANKQFLVQLPIRRIDFSDPADAARHERMVALVQQMLDLHKKLAAASVPAERALYQQQVAATDREIDALVYALYGLTEEEIAIVERQE